MLSPNRPLPGRWPPYSSPVGSSTGMNAIPKSGSTLICPHTPAFPVVSAESFSQVSCPNSPGRGIVWKIQTLARANVEPAHVSIDVVFYLRHARRAMSRTDDDHVARHH